MQRKIYENRDITIPSGLNVMIAISSYVIAGFCLWGAAHSTTILAKLLFAIAFSYVGNTIFSLLHESVHKVFSSSSKLNYIFGNLSAAFFPTGFTLQRAFHLGHHRRNRTDYEMFDMYYSTDLKPLKYLQWYFVITGFYWTSAPIAGILYLLAPGLLKVKVLRSKDPRVQHMSADAMLAGIEKINTKYARVELLFTLLFQASLFYFLGLNFWSWILCYWCFAINWGSLQYADHAWTPRDIKNGAWNLKVNPVVHWIFLHYHHHKAHHQNPFVPWLHLHRFVDFKEHRPTHFGIWLKMWKGPTPATSETPPLPLDQKFEDVLYQGLKEQVR